MKFSKILLVFLITYILGCTEKTTFSGKIISENELSSINIKNKTQLINKFGQPSFIDSIQNKYFYYTEMKKNQNFYNQKIEYSYLFVFEFDENENIINSDSIDLLNKEVLYQKKITKNNIIERGLLEKIFGGVGPNQIPNSP